MSHPLDNLGDYNVVRDDLYNAGGSKDALYKKIGYTAVLKVAPYMITVSLAAGAACLKLGQKISHLWNERKQAIENEPKLKKEFMKTVEGTAQENVSEEPTRDLPPVE